MTGGTLHPILLAVWRYWQDGGILMGPLAVVTFLIGYRYLVLLRNMKTLLSTPDDWEKALENRLRQNGQGAATVSWLRTVPGATPRVVRHVLARADAGLPLHEAFQQCREAELAEYSHSFYGLGGLVTVAPLLGLLGTVLGMIETFDAVAMRSEGTGQLVASGISQALITTQVGLVAALPGTFGLAHLYRLFHRLRNQIDQCESLLFLTSQTGRPT